MSEYYTNDEGKIVVKVPVEFTMINNIELEFDSIEDMRKKLNDEDFVDAMPLGHDPYYLDDSYTINFSSLEEEFGQSFEIKEGQLEEEGVGNE